VKSRVEVKRSICAMCQGNCGILVYVKDGKILKMAGNPDNPVSRGFTCKRLASALQWLHHPDQIMHSLKRVGRRGEGKWAKIGYEEALDEIADKLRELKENHGPETVAVSEGTLRYAEFWMRARFMNLFGSPNMFSPGVVCGLNRETMGAAIAGFRICHKVGDFLRTRCLVQQATNPKGFSPKIARQLRMIKELDPGRLRIIAIDPRDTGIASEKTDIHLRIRPGTDAALMLGWLHIIIGEELYDRDFVEKYTFGFDKLAQRVQEYPPQKVADITGIPVAKILESARVFATTKPAFITGGVGTDQIGFNSTRVEQAAASVMAITGNIDIPGGRVAPTFPGIVINGRSPLRDSDLELTHMLSKEQRATHIGGDRFKLMGYPGYEAWAPNYERYYGVPGPAMHTVSASEPMIYRGILNGDPKRVRALISWASNVAVRSANTKLVYEALKSPNLELSVAMEFIPTPTSQLADYVIASASSFERPYWTTMEDFNPNCCFGEKAIEPMGERKDDYFFWRGLATRLGQEEYWPWETHEEVMAYRAAPIGYSFEQLIAAGGLPAPVQFKKYETRGFATNTGKFELYSTILEQLGYDPLPYYKEPPESPTSTPEVAREYPLILITGGRSVPQYHSEFRQMGTGLRERHPDPVMDINVETAGRLGITNGDWVYVETKRGRIKQKAHVTEGIRPDVVNCEASWTYPEMPAEEPSLHGLWESSVNVVTLDDPDACDELVGGWALRALLCKVYRA
jgi:thiosulfate reductase / polysulfide reductase chain A